MAAGFAAEVLARAKEQAPVLVQRVKSYCPGACADGTGPGGPTEGTGLRGGTEMSNFQNYTEEGGYAETSLTNGARLERQGSSVEVDEFGGKGQEKIDEWQAGWNVTNAIQGMFIVSLPYSVQQGGYWGIFALVFVAYICCHTGKILVECLYEYNDRGELVRVRDSYVSIAKVCLGSKWGSRSVHFAQVTELLMTCILYIVLCGDLMVGSFPDSPIDQRSWIMIFTMILLPCAFLRDLRSVSMLSFWCTMAHLFINVIILGYCLLCAGDWGWGKVSWSINMDKFPVTMGIVVFSYTSQIFLPSLEGNMIDRSKFHCMLNWSHIAAALFKAIFAWMCFLTWTDETQEVITNNLPTRGFKIVVNLILVAKALFSYPLPYFAAAALLEHQYFRERPKTLFPSCYAIDGELRVWGLAARVGLVLFTMLLAVSIPYFALLMGLIGSFTGTMLSFIWPCYFHMKLKWNQMETAQICWEVFIIVFGGISGIIGIFTSFAGLVEAYHLPMPPIPVLNEA
ncbi:vesicular inhibitory amino acid transporter-like [Tropilaelaps mercedesae]|uniref:Vesicular inhibitory amino acid transporter n=1 Tax=Tropilaelaps mercedesae TaxID=418985 RepID=A0A1V9XA40_9ACAR|nr:vesicular inhibitory amino acid transporter-like [Tropilaelaps mercedesae]